MDDEPLEEARGPHLPDAMTAIPWLAWAFILLAIVDFIWIWNDATLPPQPNVQIIIGFAIGEIWSVSACLLPAALLVRHRDAASQASILLAGAILYALAQGAHILGQPLQAFFEQLTPASDDLPFLISSAVYSLAGSAMAALGIAAIGLGLSQARRFEDRPSKAVPILVVVAIALALLSLADSVFQIGLGDVTVTPLYAVFLGAGIVVAILRIVAWAYFAAMAAKGLRAGEDPETGWRLGAFGGSFVLVTITGAMLLDLIGQSTSSPDASLMWVSYAWSAIFALGHICLLAAFAVGLPALGQVGETDDESDDDFYEESDFEDDDLDELGWPVADAPGG